VSILLFAPLFLCQLCHLSSRNRLVRLAKLLLNYLRIKN